MADSGDARRLSDTDLSGNMVKVCALVPRSLHEQFVVVLPQKGAVAWTIRSAMEAIVNILTQEPGLQHKVEVHLRRRIGEMPDYVPMPLTPIETLDDASE